MPFTSVDLPAPETPVTATRHPSGNSTSTSLRLFSAAPISLTLLPLPRRRCDGTSILRRPARYAPVTDRSAFITSRGAPEATISPPSSPAPGPKSTIQSASSMVSSSCSTTMTELPRSRSRLSVANRRMLSRWCRPMDGSSRM